MKKIPEDLNKIRIQIDEVDEKIHSLLIKRALLVKKVASIKNKQSPQNPIYYRPDREGLILRSIMKKQCQPFSSEMMAKIFRTIMSACLALEKQLKIAFQGSKGSYGEMAALKHFGEFVNPVSFNTVQEVIYAVEYKIADLGVVLVEYSNEELVNETIESLLKTTLLVIGEVFISTQQGVLRYFILNHQLGSPTGNDMTTFIIKNVKNTQIEVIQQQGFNRIKKIPSANFTNTKNLLVDVEIHQENPNFEKYRNILDSNRLEYRILGSYTIPVY